MEGGLEKHVASSVVPSWVVVKIPTQRYFGSFEALFFPRGDGRWTVDPLFCAPHPWVLDTQCQIRCTPYRTALRRAPRPPSPSLRRTRSAHGPTSPKLLRDNLPATVAPLSIYIGGALSALMSVPV